MPPTCCRRLALRRLAPSPAQSLAFLGLVPVSASIPAPTLVALPNDLFQEFIRTYIEKVRDQAPVALVAPDIEAKDNPNRPLKPRKPNLYYSNLYMESYYFCQ